MGKRSVRVVIAVVAMFVFVVGAMGCSNSPRDYATVTATNQSQLFQGFVPAGGGTVTLQVLVMPSYSLCSVADEGGGTWTNVENIPVSTTASFVDECGVKWYEYKKTRALKNTSSHWCDFGGYAGSILRSHYRVLWGGQPIKTFGTNAESTCQPSSKCGQAVINECAAPEPMAHLVCLTPTVGGNCQVKY